MQIEKLNEDTLLRAWRFDGSIGVISDILAKVNEVVHEHNQMFEFLNTEPLKIKIEELKSKCGASTVAELADTQFEIAAAFRIDDIENVLEEKGIYEFCKMLQQKALKLTKLVIYYNMLIDEHAPEAKHEDS